MVKIPVTLITNFSSFIISCKYSHIDNNLYQEINLLHYTHTHTHTHTHLCTPCLKIFQFHLSNLPICLLSNFSICGPFPNDSLCSLKRGAVTSGWKLDLAMFLKYLIHTSKKVVPVQRNILL